MSRSNLPCTLSVALSPSDVWRGAARAFRRAQLAGDRHASIRAALEGLAAGTTAQRLADVHAALKLHLLDVDHPKCTALFSSLRADLRRASPAAPAPSLAPAAFEAVPSRSSLESAPLPAAATPDARAPAPYAAPTPAAAATSARTTGAPAAPVLPVVALFSVQGHSVPAAVSAAAPSPVNQVAPAPGAAQETGPAAMGPITLARLAAMLHTAQGTTAEPHCEFYLVCNNMGDLVHRCADFSRPTPLRAPPSSGLPGFRWGSLGFSGFCGFFGFFGFSGFSGFFWVLWVL